MSWRTCLPFNSCEDTEKGTRDNRQELTKYRLGGTLISVSSLEDGGE